MEWKNNPFERIQFLKINQFQRIEIVKNQYN